VVNFYEVIGVQPGATTDAVRRAYLSKARLAHPDFHVGADSNARSDAERQMRELNEAWAVLGDAQRRRDYDATLQEASRQARAKRPRGTADPSFVPFVDDETDYVAILDDAPAGNGATVPRSVQVAPAMLLILAVFFLCVGLVASFPPLLAVGACCFLGSLVAFVITPAIAVMRSLESDRD